MANDWHYTLNGQQAAAPVSAAQLKQLAVAGQLKPNDLVWQDGMTDWVPASALKGLFSAGGKSISDSAIVPPPSANRTPISAKTGKPSAPMDWANMHPALVLVLTIFTGGIFGLVYVYQLGRLHGARGVRQADTAGRPLGRVRHPLWVLMLSYLTGGLYFYYWVYRILRECGAYASRKDINPRTELSLMLIFPPYIIYVVIFQLADLIRRTQALAGLPEMAALRQSPLFLNPCLWIGLPFLGMIYQDALNQTWLNAP